MGNISNKTLSELSAGDEFIARCRTMGFDKLEDILILSPAELIATEGFSYCWLGELTELLSKHGALHLLQTQPGRTF